MTNLLKAIRDGLSAIVFTETLQRIIDNDTDYEKRNKLVYSALGVAARAGYACGVRVDPATPEWPVVYIELPTGQVSWHLPQHEREWDGHDTEEKFRRVRAFIAQQESAP